MTKLLKKQVGHATAAPGQQPQGPPQQPKKAALKPEPKPTPPPSPAIATADAAAAPTSAAAATSLPTAASVKSVQGMSHDTGKPEAAAAPRQHALGTAPSPVVPPAPASSASHQASHVKMEAASRSASPGAQGQDRRRVQATAGAVPGSAPQASTRQRVDSAPKQSDTGPSAQSEQPQVTLEISSLTMQLYNDDNDSAFYIMLRDPKSQALLHVQHCPWATLYGHIEWPQYTLCECKLQVCTYTPTGKCFEDMGVLSVIVSTASLTVYSCIIAARKAKRK